jgi:hypothetical protein
MSEPYRVVQGFREDGVRWTVYRGERPVETFRARAVAEACAHALNADLEAARPRPEIPDVPAEADVAEAEANRARDAATDVALADALADAPTYVPAEADAREASQLFGELEDDLNVAEFEAWLEGLHHERFRQVSQAIDVLRGALAEYREDVGMRDVADWID